MGKRRHYGGRLSVVSMGKTSGGGSLSLVLGIQSRVFGVLLLALWRCQTLGGRSSLKGWVF